MAARFPIGRLQLLDLRRGLQADLGLSVVQSWDALGIQGLLRGSVLSHGNIIRRLWRSGLDLISAREAWSTPLIRPSTLIRFSWQKAFGAAGTSGRHSW